MKFLKTIPNLLTCLNLICGFIAIILSFKTNNLIYAALMIFAATVFDFLDGFSARIFKAYTENGKQLDSLADMVSFGIAPGIIAYQLLHFSSFIETQNIKLNETAIILLSALIPVCSAIRLAKFNLDERQSVSFLGLPTPACAFLFASIALLTYTSKSPEIQKLIINEVTLIILIIVNSLLMVSELPMFSFKMKSPLFKNNGAQFLFMGMSVIVLVIFRLYALPLIVCLYILTSIIIFFVKPRSN